MNRLRNLIPPPMAVLILILGYLVYAHSGKTAVNPNLETSMSSGPEQTVADLDPGFRDLAAPGEYAARLSKASERPLFSQTRRNPEPLAPESNDRVTENQVEDGSDALDAETPIVEAAPVRPEDPEIEFVGFLSTNGKNSALVRNTTTGFEEWLTIGDTLDDWTVSKISKTQIQLTRDSFELFVEIKL